MGDQSYIIIIYVLMLLKFYFIFFFLCYYIFYFSKENKHFFFKVYSNGKLYNKVVEGVFEHYWPNIAPILII